VNRRFRRNLESADKGYRTYEPYSGDILDVKESADPDANTSDALHGRQALPQQRVPPHWRPAARMG